MNKLILAALATAALIPGAAMATPGHDTPQGGHVAMIHRDSAQASEVKGKHDAKETHRIVVGTRIAREYLAKRYAIAHPTRYHLFRAADHQRWVRVRNDAVLVNLHSGRVAAVRARVFS